MPLGKTPILQNDLMAEGSNNKHLLFNDALVALEDASNRAIVVDLTASDVVVTESQILRYAVLWCTGHAVARELTLPNTVGEEDAPLNRVFAVRNDGSAPVTVTLGSGSAVTIPGGETGLLYTDGSDVISLGGVANAASIPVQEDGTEVASRVVSLNFTGNAVAVTDGGAGALTVTIDVEVPESLFDLGLPSATGHSGKMLVVNATEDGFDYADAPTAGSVKTLYESNADTNAFTDAEKTKLAGLESPSFKGTYANLTALNTAHPTAAEGSYAYVDAGVGETVQMYIWDNDDTQWVVSAGEGTAETPASIKSKYESNADTNSFTDAEQAKLAGIEAGATGDLTGAEIVSAIDSELGSEDWKSGGGGGGVSLPDMSGHARQVLKVNASETSADWEPYGASDTEDEEFPFGDVSATALSGSAYQTKGLVFTVSGPVTMEAVRSYMGAGQTVRAALFELSAFGIATEKIAQSGALAITSTGAVTFDFGRRITLDNTGGRYALLFTRTDGGPTSVLELAFPGTAPAVTPPNVSFFGAVREPTTYDVGDLVPTYTTAAHTPFHWVTSYERKALDLPAARPADGGKVLVLTEDGREAYWTTPADATDVAMPLVPTAASLTLTQALRNSFVEASAALTVTIPAQADEEIEVGSLYTLTNIGTGVLTLTAATGVALNGVSARTVTIPDQWAGVTLYKRAADAWVVQGAFTAGT